MFLRSVLWACYLCFLWCSLDSPLVDLLKNFVSVNLNRFIPRPIEYKFNLHLYLAQNQKNLESLICKNDSIKISENFSGETLLGFVSDLSQTHARRFSSIIFQYSCRFSFWKASISPTQSHKF